MLQYMRKIVLLLFSAFTSLIILLFGCNTDRAKEVIVVKPENSVQTPKDTCLNVSSKGRIIGFNPFMSFLNFDTSRFVKWDSTLGPGYLIEIENGLTKDTVITYRITYNNFILSPSKNKTASMGFFKSEYQDSLKIRFNYKIVDNKTKLIPFFSTTDGAYVIIEMWLKFIENRNEVALSCVASN